MNIVEFTDKFLEIERELDLFEDRPMGIAWWDAVRYDVFHLVYYRVSGLSPPARARRPAYRRIAGFAARLWLRSLLWIRLLSCRHDFLVFRCARNRQDGKRSDIVMDEVMSVLSGRTLVIDTAPLYYHRNFSESGLPERPRLLDQLARAIDRVFGLPDGFDDFVMHRLAAFAASVPAYEAIFRRATPRAVLMIQNGVEKGMFVAARRLRIPVVELQHGLINYVHAGYSYPREISYEGLPTFPDHFWAFSQYWIDTCHYPATHRVVIGNNHYYVDPTPCRSGDALFVSALVYDKVLRPWVKQVASSFPGRRFVYKLHPNQLEHESDIRADLSAFANVSVVGNERRVRDLLPDVSFVVLIQSTVAHESLQAGKTVCLVSMFDYQTHADLFSLPQVALVPTVEALKRVLASPPIDAPAPVYFDPLDRPRVAELMGKVAPGMPASTLSAPLDAGAAR